MERYGVGRPAVRQALLTLERMGLVKIASGERARVTKPSPKVLTDTLGGRRPAHPGGGPDGARHFQMARLFFEAGPGPLGGQSTPPDEDHRPAARRAGGEPRRPRRRETPSTAPMSASTTCWR